MDFLDQLGNFKRLKKESMQWSQTQLQLVRRLLHAISAGCNDRLHSSVFFLTTQLLTSLNATRKRQGNTLKWRPCLRTRSGVEGDGGGFYDVLLPSLQISNSYTNKRFGNMLLCCCIVEHGYVSSDSGLK